jgi:hypothetical protein
LGFESPFFAPRAGFFFFFFAVGLRAAARAGTEGTGTCQTRGATIGHPRRRGLIARGERNLKSVRAV